MPNIPVINIGGTDYNVKDTGARDILKTVISDAVYASEVSDWQSYTMLKSSDEVIYYGTSSKSIATKVAYPCGDLEGMMIGIDCPSNYKYKIAFTKTLTGQINTDSISFHEGDEYPKFGYISEIHKDILIPESAGFILAISKSDESAISPSNLPSGFKVVVKSVKHDTLDETNKILSDYAYVHHINLFDKDSDNNSKNQYLDPDGLLQKAADYTTSPYIDVSDFKTLYPGHIQILAFFDADYHILSDTYNSSAILVASLDVPVNAKYIRVTAYGNGKDIAYLSAYKMYYKTHDKMISPKLYMFEDKIVGSDGKPIFDHFNMFDVNSFENAVNQYITPDGSLAPADKYTTSPYIALGDFQTLYIDHLQIYAFFDSDFKIISDTYNPSGITTRVLQRPGNAHYFRATMYGSGKDIAFISPYKRELRIYDEVISKNLYLFESRIIDDAVVVKSGESMLNGIQKAYSNGIKKVIVEAGMYDIIEEYKARYGDDYFSTYTTNYNNQVNGMFDTGVWLENIELVFAPGSKVVCNYLDFEDPEYNEHVTTYFSPFSVGKNVILDGLVLDSTNCRYGIHPDFYSNVYDMIYFIMRNCDLYHYSHKEGGTYYNNQAVGAGLGIHSYWLIENNIFRSEGPTPFVFRVHNNVSEESLSKVIIRNNYIDGDGYFSINSYSTSDLMTPVLMYGNSWETEPVFGLNTPDSHVNMQKIAWNNELRVNS